jgi:23S rRNA maturation mini-RNase III
MEISQISAGALAYLGDAVLESIIRERLVLKGYDKSSKLNKKRLLVFQQSFSIYENILSTISLALAFST